MIAMRLSNGFPNYIQESFLSEMSTDSIILKMAIVLVSIRNCRKTSEDGLLSLP